MFFHFYFLYTSIHCVCFNTRVVFQTFAVIVAYIIIARYSVCTLITVLNDTNINLKLNPCAHVALSLLSLNIYMYSSLVRSWGLVQYWTVVLVHRNGKDNSLLFRVLSCECALCPFIYALNCAILNAFFLQSLALRRVFPVYIAA